MALIDKEAIKKFIADGLNSGEFGHDAVQILAEVEYMPTVDAEPVRHAKVVTVTDRYYTMHQECSYCGGELGWKEYPIYCPNCGAKLDDEVRFWVKSEDKDEQEIQREG